MKRLIAAVCICGLVTGSQAGAAPPPPAADPSALLDAVKATLVRAATLYTDSGDYAGALAACQLALTTLEAYRPEWEGQARARAYRGRAWLLSAFAEEKSGHVRGAIAAYRTYLERFPDARPEDRHEAETSLGQLAQLGFLMPELTPTDAALEVDGKTATPDATGRIALTAGRHLVVVRAAAYRTSRQFVTVVAGQDLALAVALGQDSWQRPAAWAAIGIGGAALTAGVVCLIVAKRDDDKVNGAMVNGVIPVGSSMTWRRAQRLWDDRDTLNGWGIAGMVTAGVAAGAAAIFFVLSPTDARATAAITPLEGGVLAQVRAPF